MNQVNNKINQKKLEGVMAMMDAARMEATSHAHSLIQHLAVLSSDAEKYYNTKNPNDIKVSKTAVLNLAGMTSQQAFELSAIFMTLGNAMVDYEEEANSYINPNSASGTLKVVSEPGKLSMSGGSPLATGRGGIAFKTKEEAEAFVAAMKAANEQPETHTDPTGEPTQEAPVKRDPNTIKPNEFVRTSDETPEPKQPSNGPVIMGKDNDE